MTNPLSRSTTITLIVAVVIIVLAVLFRQPISQYLVQPTPTPSPTPSPTPTPTPTPLPTPVVVTSTAPAPSPMVSASCSPATQTVKNTEYAVFSSSDPNTRWTAPGGIPATGVGGRFTTIYYAPGTKVVTANGINGAGACRVEVVASGNLSTPSSPWWKFKSIIRSETPTP